MRRPAQLGRAAAETLGLIDAARKTQPVHLDCYPYTAGSTVIRPDLADGEVEILINWSTPHPEMGGRMLKGIAEDWGVSEPEAAERLMPGGASYFQMHEQEHAHHPGATTAAWSAPTACRTTPCRTRACGAPSRACWAGMPRELNLLKLETAVHKMTGLAADTFALGDRGRIAVGLKADITVFDATTIIDRSTYESPVQIADGITHVLVNGVMAWTGKAVTPLRAGRFLRGAGAASLARPKAEVAG